MIAQFIGFIVEDTLLVTDMLSGALAAGLPLSGDNVLPATSITLDETGNGAAGAYKITPPQTVPATVFTTLVQHARPAVAQFVGFIVEDTLIVTEVLFDALVVGAPISGDGVAPGTSITLDEGGNGGAGAYKVTPLQTVSATVMTTLTHNPRRTLVSATPVRTLS